jgi:hypothetical protein
MGTKINDMRSRLRRKVAPGQSEHTGLEEHGYPFPDAGNEDREKPRPDLLNRVVMVIVYLLVAVYVGTVVKLIVEGKPVLYVGPGARPPCDPPSQGVWPDCHDLKPTPTPSPR